MKGKHKNPTASRFSVPIVAHNDAHSDEEVIMVEITLFIHSDGRSPNFYALFTSPVTGKTVSFSCRTSDRDAAFQFAQRTLPKLIAKAYRTATLATMSNTSRAAKPAFTPITLSEFRDVFIDSRVTRRGQPLRPKSRKAFQDSFNSLIRHITDKKLHTITFDECNEFVMNAHRTDRSAQKHFTNLRAAFNEAMRRGHLVANPLDGVKPRHPEYTNQEFRDRLFTDEEFDRLFEFLPTATYSDRRLRNQLVFAKETGMRFGEFRHVRLDWIDLNGYAVEVRSGNGFLPKTRAGDRFIPLSDDAVNAITQQLVELANHACESIRRSQYLFPGLSGQPLSEAAVWLPFNRARSKAFSGRKPKLHGLRHNFVSRLSQMGIPDRQILDWVGHDDIAMIRRYSHSDKRLASQGREALNRSNQLRRSNVSNDSPNAKSVLATWNSTA